MLDFSGRTIMVTCVIEMLLEVVLVICDTKVTSADELIMKGVDLTMVEFGEQLRRAREEKGMTQQSLAEQLYVTRQAVSRWECGVSHS
jgi:DNA-binding XRE family transcriptional regulator